MSLVQGFHGMFVFLCENSSELNMKSSREGLYMKWFVPFKGSKGQSNCVSRVVPVPLSKGKFLGTKLVAKRFQRQTVIRGSG